MRRRFSTFLVWVALVLLASLQAVGAGTPPASQIENSGVCGKTVAENLTAARKALQSSDPTARAALACLIEATAALDARVAIADHTRAPSGLLHVPDMDHLPAAGHP